MNKILKQIIGIVPFVLFALLFSELIKSDKFIIDILAWISLEVAIIIKVKTGWYQK